MLRLFKRIKLLNELAHQVSLLQIKRKTLKAHLIHKDWSDRLVEYARTQIKEHESSIDKILKELER